ncbi:MAG: phaR [Pedosphaera sp.]|nr:phaR [Pedosphaera sp.]
MVYVAPLRNNSLLVMAENNEPNPKQLEIRKYPNRRYYDVTRSQHLTMEDIRLLVRDGYDIRVTDSKTATDITAKVLAQIILELDGEKIDIFPAALLMRMIRVNDQLAKDFMGRYFDQALSVFIQYRQQVEEQLRGGDGFGALYSSLANWNRAMLNPFNMPFMGGAGAPAAGAMTNSENQDLQEKISSLEKNISTLEAKLVGNGRPRRSKTRRAKANGK